MYMIRETVSWHYRRIKGKKKKIKTYKRKKRPYSKHGKVKKKKKITVTKRFDRFGRFLS